MDTKRFIKELKKIHPQLTVQFKRNYWIVYQEYYPGRFHFIMRVQNDDGTPRPLDNRTLEECKRIVYYDKKCSASRMEEICQEAEEQQEKQERYQLKEEVGEAIEDTMKKIYKPNDFGFVLVPSGFESK